MARIIYALSGHGRGHTSRAQAMAASLRERGHTVAFCCGGPARRRLKEQGEFVVPVRALPLVVEANRVRLLRTVCCNARTVLSAPQIVRQLAAELSAWSPDLLVADFEPFSPWAARQLGLPVVAFSRQHVLTEAAHRLPMHLWPAALFTAFVVRLLTPRRPAHVLLPSFSDLSLKHPDRVTLVPPPLRPDVQALAPTRGDHVLVYYNQTSGSQHVLEALRQVDAVFVLYNFSPPAHPADYPNLTFKRPSREGFLRDLASCRAVLCTAGFTLMSEALHLNKPLLVVPNRGDFEQRLNARLLEQEGLGEAISGRPLTARDVAGFLRRAVAYTARMQEHTACGNRAAAAQIERALTRRIFQADTPHAVRPPQRPTSSRPPARAGLPS